MLKKLGMARSEVIGLLCCAGFTFIFCCHYVVAPRILGSITPIALGAARGIVGGVILLCFARGQMAKIRTLRQCLLLIAVGLFGFCFNQIFMLRGLMLTHPANAAIFANMIPLLTVGVGVAAFSVRITVKQTAGLIVGGGGAMAYVFWAQHLSPVSGGLGNGLLLASVLSFAVAVNLIRVLLVELPGEVIAAAMLGLGGVVLLVLSGGEVVDGVQAVMATPKGTVLLLFELVVTTAVGYFLNVEALRRLGVSKTASFAFFQPPVTAALVWASGGASPGWSALACFCLVLVANFLVATSNGRSVCKEPAKNSLRNG